MSRDQFFVRECRSLGFNHNELAIDRTRNETYVDSLCFRLFTGCRRCPAQRRAADGLTPRSGVDPTGFKNSVRPQDDFFRYVNGAWIDRTDIPADQSMYGSATALRDKSESDVRAILEQSVAQSG